MRTYRLLWTSVVTVCLALLGAGTDLQTEDDLVAAYALDESAGLVAADVSGNGNTGALSNDPTWVSGYVGSGLSFDGTNDGVQLPASETLRFTTGLTVEMWVRPTAFGPQRYLVQMPGADWEGLRLNGDGKPSFHATFTSGNNNVIGPAPLPLNTWSHLAVTFDGAWLRMYVSGAEVANVAVSGSLPASATQAMWLGRARPGNAFAGEVDEVRIYRRALTASEVVNDMTAPIDETSVGLAIATRAPIPSAVGVLAPDVRIVFNKQLTTSSASASNFGLVEVATGSSVPTTVSYDAATRRVTLTATEALVAGQSYRVEVTGGTGGVQDVSGGTLAADESWIYRRAEADTVPSAAYALDEGTGLVTADVSGNGNAGALSNGPAWVSGYAGGALSFDGTNDGVELPASETLRFTTGLTLEMWVRPTAFGPQRYLVQMPGADWDGLRLNGDGKPWFQTTFTSGNNNVGAPAPLPLNTWSHLAITFDGAWLRMYVNGGEVANRAVSGSLPASATKAMWLGRARPGSPFAGEVDEVRIYRRALTAAEVVNDMTAPIDETFVGLAIATRAPIPNAVGVLAPDIRIVFNKQLTTSSVSAANFSLVDVASGNAAPVTVSYDAATRRVTLTPTEQLFAGQSYRVEVTGEAGGVQDISGGTLATDESWIFQRAEADTTPSAAYALDEGAGIVAADVSGNGNTGALSNDPTWVSGYVGSGLSFDGTNDGVQLPASETLSFTTGLTLEMWVRPTAFGPQRYLVQMPGADWEGLRLNGDGKPWFQTTFTSGNNNVGAPSPLPLNAWSHLAVTFDGAWLRMFVNGGEVANRAISGGLPASAMQAMWLGRARPGNPFAGEIDEVRIYRRAITAAEILSDMETPLGDTERPSVISTDPADGAGGVAPSAPIHTTFSEPIAPGTLSSSSFELRDSAGALVPGAVTYSAGSNTATLQPVSALAEGSTYTVALKGDPSEQSISDLAGNRLAADHIWGFTTGGIVSAPTFSPAAGMYAPGQLITISSATPAAVIHFTINGAEPTINDPWVVSGGTINSGTFTLKARAFRPNWTPSSTTSAEFIRNADPCAYQAMPNSVAVDFNAAWGALAVTTNDCAWTASSNMPWVSVASTRFGYAGAVSGGRPAGYWRLNELDGVTAADGSGNGLDGTYVGEVTRGVPGPILDGTTAVTFSTGYVDVGDHPSLDPNGGPFTLQAWVKFDDSVNGTIAGKGGFVGYRLEIRNGGVRFVGQGFQNGFNVETPNILNDGLWHHLVGVADTGVNEARLYIDGALVATDESADALLVSSGNMVIGAGQEDIEGFLASIDEVAYYSRALTEDEVEQHFAQRSSVGLIGDGAVLYAIEANPTVETRIGTLTIGDLAVQLTQSGVPCFTVAPDSVELGAGGGSGAIQVNAVDSGCAWTASSNQSWVTVQAPSSAGSGDVTYTVGMNPSQFIRTAIITIAGRPVTLRQAGAAPQRPAAGYGVAMGSQHALALKNDGSAWSWGANAAGQLGDGTSTSRTTAAQVASLSDIVAIAAGGTSSFALRSDGTLWSWGANNVGQLGDGSTTPRSLPGQIPGLTDVVSIAAGSEHSIALRGDATVWTWGRNNWGQLGDGSQTNRTTPVQIEMSVPAVAVAADGFISVVLHSDGTVSWWGQNRTTFEGEIFTFAMTTPTLAEPLSSPIERIGAGAFHALGVTSQGAALGWGFNSEGQLGDGTTNDALAPAPVRNLEGATDADGGGDHSAAVMSDGTIRAWGHNNTGQIGDGTHIDRLTSVAVPGPVSIGALSISGGSNLAVSTDGRIWAWGANFAGQLGDGTSITRLAPVQTSESGLSWRTATPSFSETESTRFSEFSVIVSCATPGAVIHYTTDGSDPTEADSVVASGGALQITGTTVLKARAFSPGPPSSVAMATYVVQVHPPSISPQGDRYTTAQTVTLASATPGATIRYTVDGTDPTEASPVYTEPVAVATGLTLKAAAFKAGWTRSNVNVAVYIMHFGTLDAPTITPNPGQYLYGQSVAVSAASFATIRYTLDGAEPAATSPAYSGPLTLTGPMTLKARAFHPDWSPSASAAAAYTAQALAPAFSPAAGTYSAGQTITLSHPTSGTVIRYTTNGQNPTNIDPAIPSGATIPVGNFTLKARAFRAGLIASEVTVAEYVKDGDTCAYTFTPAPLTSGARPSGGVIKVVTSSPACSWTAVSALPWMTLGVGSGVGNGEIPYYFAANPGPTDREGALAIADRHVGVTQAGASACAATIAPAALATSSGEVNGTLAVTSTASCTWTATSNASWLTLGSLDAAGPYNAAVLGDHPVGYWRLNDVSGSVSVADTSGFDHPGAISGVLTLGEPSALRETTTTVAFDGTSGSIQIPHSSSFDFARLSWETWVNVPTVSAQPRRILAKGTGDEAFSLSIGASATQATVAWTLEGGARQTALLNAVVVGAGWTHLAFTYDGTIWRTYVNGNEDQSGTVTSTLRSSADPIVLGSNGGLGEWFDGQLGDVALFSYALAPDQIANHFAQRTMAAIGNGDVSYTIASNDTGSSRIGSVSAADRVVPVAQAATGGVVIAAHASPYPNAAGWNPGEVVVSFTCAGDGIVSCPDPVTVDQDGVREISGSASNDLGASATAFVTVRVDRTAPIVTIESPTVSAIVSPGPLTVTGTAADTLSEASVTCNGDPAVVDGFRFSCEVAVPAGPSTVVVRAVDQAGNARSVTLDVDTTDLASRPPTSVRITPQEVTMRIGELRQFSLMDDLGRVPQNAVWSVDDPAVASITTTPRPELTALAAGEVTVTATWQGLSAVTHVTVSALETLPAGTTTWSAPPIHGTVKKIVHGSFGPDGTRLTYVLESSGEPGSHDLIRSFDADGAEQWVRTMPGLVSELTGDAMGGVLALYSSSTPGEFTLTRVAGGGGTTGITVESAPNLSGFKPGTFAVHPDGPVYVVKDGVLTGVDVGMGAGRTASLPADTAAAGTPTIMADGTVVVPVVTSQILTESNTVYLPDMKILMLPTEGPSRIQTISNIGSRPWSSVYPFKAIPNGLGGLIVMWNDHYNFAAAITHYRAMYAVLDEEGVEQGRGDAGWLWGDIVLAADGLAWAVADSGDSTWRTLTKIHPATGGSYAYFLPPSDDVTSIVAVEGGLVLGYRDGRVAGPDPAFEQMSMKDLRYSDGSWKGVSAGGGLNAMIGPSAELAETQWAEKDGDESHSQRAANPGTGLFVKGHPIILGWWHTALRIVPRNQKKWRNGPMGTHFTNIDEASRGNYFMTFGAGSDLGSSCSGKLKSEFNRSRDVEIIAWQRERLRYSPALEDAWIQKFFDLDARYNDLLQYECLPDAGQEEYNSNGYVSGLLRAAMIPEPAFPNRFLDRYAGWNQPVPASSFR